jgi:hypothetical protein
LSVLGAVQVARRPAGDRLALALGGWMLACAAFLAIGILTPVDMRYYLAAVPMIAVTGGYGAAWAWNEGWSPHRTLSRITAAALLAGTIWIAFHNWWNVLG